MMDTALNCCIDSRLLHARVHFASFHLLSPSFC